MPTRASLGLPDVRGRTPLLAGLAIDSFGGGCAGPLLLLYFNRVADIPLGRAGVLLTLASLVSLVVPALVGHVIDRVGPRNLVVLAQVAQGLAFTMFLLGRSAPLMFGAAVVMVAGQRVFWSSIFSLLSDIADAQDRDRWFGLAGMMQAAGFGLGSLAAGALLAIGGDGPLIVAMAVNAVSFGVAAVLLGRLAVRHDPAQAGDGEEKARLRDNPRFVALIAVNGILALCTMLIGVGLPVYVVDALPAPDWLVGILLAGISVTLATGQTLVIRFSAGRRRTRVLVLSGMLWAAWGLLMAALLHVPAGVVVPLLVLATVVFAAADVLHAATSNALAAAIAPEGGRGKYLSYWQYSFTLAQIAVPAFFAGLFEVRADLPWLVLAGLATVAAGAVLVLERGLREPARV